MDSPGHQPSWVEAAEQASFAWFVPVRPQPQQTWAGGFGWDADGPTGLDVEAVCDGVAVSVETRRVDSGWSEASAQRMMIHGWLFHALVADHRALTLPLTIVLEPDVRIVAVDGHDVSFSGVRLAGSDRWTGMAVVGDVAVKIALDAQVSNLAIASSTDTTLTERR